MLIISDRDNFWSTSEVSSQTSWREIQQKGEASGAGGFVPEFLPNGGLSFLSESAEVEENLLNLDFLGGVGNLRTRLFSESQVDGVLQGLNGKRILLLIHGYNNTREEVLKSYFTINKDMQTWGVKYDHIIGYVWPGGSNFLEYYGAQAEADRCAPLLRKLLEQLSYVAGRLDVLAHSMGNLLFLESLNKKGAFSKKNLVQMFYSVAPAVDDRALAGGRSFYQATLHIGDMVIFFSSRDPVEKVAYPFVEAVKELKPTPDDLWAILPASGDPVELAAKILLNGVVAAHRTRFPQSLVRWMTFRKAVLPKALGHDGGGAIRLPMNVQTVDCSGLVDSHSGYFAIAAFYLWIKGREEGKIGGPDVIQDMVLRGDGSVAINFSKGDQQSALRRWYFAWASGRWDPLQIGRLFAGGGQNAPFPLSACGLGKRKFDRSAVFGFRKP